MAVEDSYFKLTDQLMELDIKARPGGFFPKQDDAQEEENVKNSQDYLNVEEDYHNYSYVEEDSKDNLYVEEDTLNTHQDGSNGEENVLNSNNDDINDMILMRMDTFVKTGNHRAFCIPL